MLIRGKPGGPVDRRSVAVGRGRDRQMKASTRLRGPTHKARRVTFGTGRRLCCRQGPQWGCVWGRGLAVWSAVAGLSHNDRGACSCAQLHDSAPRRGRCIPRRRQMGAAGAAAFAARSAGHQAVDHRRPAAHSALRFAQCRSIVSGWKIVKIPPYQPGRRCIWPRSRSRRWAI